MPRPCSVCVHASRTAIEAALAAGDALREVARRFGVSKTALGRHGEHATAAGPKALRPPKRERKKRDEKADQGQAKAAPASHARGADREEPQEFDPFPKSRADRVRYVVDMMTASPQPTWVRGKTGPLLAAFAGCSLGCIEDIAAEASRQIKNVVDKDYVRGRIAWALHEGVDVARAMSGKRPATTEDGTPIVLPDGTPILVFGDVRALTALASLAKTYTDLVGAGAPTRHEVTGANGEPISGLPTALAALDPTVEEVERYVVTGELPRRDPKAIQ